MVVDLEGRGFDFRVAEEVHDELAVEVADADGFRQAGLLHFLHRLPGFLDGGVSCDDVFAVVGEAGGVADGRVDVLEGDGKVHDVEVEIVDAPVLKLFSTDGFNAVVVVKGIPEFGDEEKVFALD